MHNWCTILLYCNIISRLTDLCFVLCWPPIGIDDPLTPQVTPQRYSHHNFAGYTGILVNINNFSRVNLAWDGNNLQEGFRKLKLKGFLSSLVLRMDFFRNSTQSMRAQNFGLKHNCKSDTKILCFLLTCNHSQDLFYEGQ